MSPSKRMNKESLVEPPTQGFICLSESKVSTQVLWSLLIAAACFNVPKLLGSQPSPKGNYREGRSFEKTFLPPTFLAVSILSLKPTKYLIQWTCEESKLDVFKNFAKHITKTPKARLFKPDYVCHSVGNGRKVGVSFQQPNLPSLCLMETMVKLKFNWVLLLVTMI